MHVHRCACDAGTKQEGWSSALVLKDEIGQAQRGKEKWVGMGVG